MLFRNKITSLGQRRGFSRLDIQKLNKLYQCQNLVTCKDFYTPQSGLCQTWKTKGGCERSFHISCPSCLPFLFSKFLAPFVLYYSSFAAVPHLLQKCLHICSAFFSLWKDFTHWVGTRFFEKKISFSAKLSLSYLFLTLGVKENFWSNGNYTL